MIITLKNTAVLWYKKKNIEIFDCWVDTNQMILKFRSRNIPFLKEAKSLLIQLEARDKEITSYKQPKGTVIERLLLTQKYFNPLLNSNLVLKLPFSMKKKHRKMCIITDRDEIDFKGNLTQITLMAHMLCNEFSVIMTGKCRIRTLL